MKIAEYNDMMSYLTRQNFSSGTNKPRTVSDLIKSKDIVTGDKYKPKNPKLIQSIRAFEEKYGFRKKESDGGPQIIPPSKPAEDPLEVFKKQADLFLQGSFGSSDKTFFNNLIEQEYNKALDAGVLPEEALSFLKEKSKLYRKLAEEGRMQGEPAILGPSYGRENKAIGGGVIEGEDLDTREGFRVPQFTKPGREYKEIDGGLYPVIQKGENKGKIEFRRRDEKGNRETLYLEDEDQVREKVEEGKQKNRDRALKVQKIYENDVNRVRDNIDNWLKNYLNKNLSKYKLREDNKFIDDLKTAWTEESVKDKYKLKPDTFVGYNKFTNESITYKGFPNFTQRQTKSKRTPFKYLNLEKPAGGRAGEEENRFRFYIKKIFFKNQIENNPQLKKDLKSVFNYVNKDKRNLNPAKFHREHAKFLTNIDPGVVYMLSNDSMPGTTRYDLYSKVFGEDYINYRKNIKSKGSNYQKNVAIIENKLGLPEGTISGQLTKEQETLKKVFRVTSLPYPFQYSMDHGVGLGYAAGTNDKTIMKQAVETLLGTTHAQNQLLGLGGWERARIKLIKDVKKDPSKLPELNEHMKIGYGSILPDQKNFYKVEGSGKNIKVTPLFTGQDQSTRFKNYVRQISTQPISAIKAAFPDKEVQNAILDFKKGKTKTLDKFLDADKTIPKTKFALPLIFGAPLVYGIGKEISQGRNPLSMSVEASEPGQLPQGSPGQINPEDKSFVEEYPLLTGAAGVAGTTGALAATKLTKPTSEFFKKPRRFAKEIAKMPLRAIGSVPTSLYLSGSQFANINPFSDEFGELKENPNLMLAGADLLLPELGKRVPGSGTGIMSKIGRGVLNPFQYLEGLGKYGRLGRVAAMGARIPTLMTPVGLTIAGAGALKEYYDFAKDEIEKVKAMSPEDRKAYNESLMDEGGMLASGGRVGYADGPEDPSKRTFMKILGGIASLPIIGRFFDVAKESKVAKQLFTEIQQLKNTQTQMPEWFPTFLNKFRKEGTAENMFKKKKIPVSKQEFEEAIASGKGENYYADPRTPEYIAQNPDHMPYFKLDDTEELVGTNYTNKEFPGVNVDDFDGEVNINFQNDYGQEVIIQYVKPGAKGLDTGRPDKVTAGIAEVEVKPKGDFSAVDQEVYATDPDGGYDTNPVVVDSLDDMLEGTTRKMEEYATGRKVKKLSKGEEKIMQADMEADSLKDYYED